MTEQSTALQWSVTTGGAYVCGPYLIAERVDDRGWNASKSNETLVLADTLERCKKACEKDAATPHPEALRLATQLEDTESARLHLLPYAAAELRRLHALNGELLAATQLCDKHAPNGGTVAACVICSGQKLSHALSRISYLCEPPNEMECSYDLHYNEDAVVAQVERLHAVNQELLEALKKLEEAARCVQAGEWDRASIDVERREARAAIAKAEGKA